MPGAPQTHHSSDGGGLGTGHVGGLCLGAEEGVPAPKGGGDLVPHVPVQPGPHVELSPRSRLLVQPDALPGRAPPRSAPPSGRAWAQTDPGLRRQEPETALQNVRPHETAALEHHRHLHALARSPCRGALVCAPCAPRAARARPCAAWGVAECVPCISPRRQNHRLPGKEEEHVEGGVRVCGSRDSGVPVARAPPAPPTWHPPCRPWRKGQSAL